VVLGLSLGATIAYELNRRKEIAIDYLFFDGAPFHKINNIVKCFIIKSQMIIRNKCRKNPHGKFKVDIIYPQLASMMKVVTAHYSDATLKNIIKEIGITLDNSIDTKKVTFLYGEKDYYRKTILDIKRNGYKCCIKIQYGCGHVQWILKEPERYAKMLIEADKRIVDS
jgi:hypothetical protein